LGIKSGAKIKAFNELMSKVLSVCCMFWAIIWLVVGIMWFFQKQYYGLSLVFLYGSPAVVYLIYRFRKYKQNSLQKIQNS